MKSILLALVFCVSAAWADQSADRVAIENTVISVAAWPPRTDIFTADFDGRAELARITRVRTAGSSGDIVISKEPWGEAVWIPPGLQSNLMTLIAVKKIRFVTADVALVDALGKRPLLFTLRRESGIWKIASLRELADE